MAYIHPDAAVRAHSGSSLSSGLGTAYPRAVNADRAWGTGRTGKGVTVFDPSGKKVAQIDVPEPWTANVCFGGKDMKTLFITASTGLYAVKMNVKGAARQ